VTSVRRQLGLLARAPSYRLLSLAALASGAGTWLSVIALTVDVFDRTHSANWVAALLIADFLPTVGIGLLLGPLVDRLSRKWLMIGADLVRFGVFVALPFADGALGIVLLAGVAGLATGFFRPASYAGVPNLVDESDLAEASALLRTIENVTQMGGTFAGGALVAASGPHPAYWLNAASFLLSALLLTGIPGRLLQATRVSSRGHLTDLVDGFRLVLGSRPLLAVFVAWSLALAAGGLVNVSEVALAKVSFHAGSFGFGLMWTATGLGSIAGSLVAARSLEKRGIGTVYGAAITLMALGTGGAAASPNVWVAVWCLGLFGIGNGAAIVYNVLLVQRNSPDALRGRVFTVLMSATYAALGLGMVVAGPVAQAVGPRWTYAAAAGIASLAAVAGRALAGGGAPQAEEVEEKRRPAAALS